MLKNSMQQEEEDKQLDFDAPLLSVRRFSSESESPSKSNPTKTKRTFLPFYKSDLKSGPIRNPGVVPFTWEQSPGQPKPETPLHRPPIKLPPGRISETVNPLEQEEDDDEEVPPPILLTECEEEDEDFSDAFDTLSRSESFFMNCSVSGIGDNGDAVEQSPSFSDLQAKNFMMGRFLPAAKAMARGSPHSSSRKPVRFVERDNQRVVVPYQSQPKFGNQYLKEEGESCSYDDDDDGDNDDYGNENLGSKACGLIPKFCMKSSFCLLYPVPGMKVGGRRLRPPPGQRFCSPTIGKLNHESLGQAQEEHSWEEVYKHKLGQANLHQGEDGSNLMSESNYLAHWSESQTADGSSPYRRSACGGISPYRNEPPQSTFHEGKVFLGVPKRERKDSKADGSDSFDKDTENYWVITPCHSSQQEPGSKNPAVERTLYVDSVPIPGTPNSKSSSVDTIADIKGVIILADVNSEVAVRSDRTEESHVVETDDRDTLQPKLSEAVESDSLSSSERLDFVGENNGLKHNSCNDCSLPLKIDQLKNNADLVLPFLPAPLRKSPSELIQSLLPPPLPKSPSESWLLRTLPSVSSMNPSTQSFLGIKVNPKKEAFSEFTTGPKHETRVKPSKVQHAQTCFADLLAKPLSPQSEI